MRKYLPEPDFFITKSLPNLPDYKITEHIASGNNGHVFLARNERIQSQLVSKIVPVENLPQTEAEKDVWLQEARKANILNHLSVVRCIEAMPWPSSEKLGSFVAFLFDYVPGISLRDYIKQTKNGITVGFIEEFLRTLLGLIFEMKLRGIEHGDLHAGNVIVAEKSDYDIESRERFRVTDFGVLTLTSSNQGTSDLLQLAVMLRDLLAKVDYQTASGRDKYAYNVLRNELLQRHLIETDPLADELAHDPRAIYDKLTKIDSDYGAQQAASRRTSLRHPFDFPNCEQIPEAHLLNSLYSSRFLGMDEIASRSNLILTGPRGCGKTTVFRAMSLEHRMTINSDRPADVDHVGIYYRCDDLYFSFPRYEHPSRSDAVNVAMHYVVVTLLAQLLETIKKWALRNYDVEFRSQEAAATQELWSLFEWDRPREPGADQFERLISRMQQKERGRAARKHRVLHIESESCDGYFGPEILLRACAMLRLRFSFLAKRPIYFFIDDYSEPKITSHLQENLNRLLMFRSPDCYFKISTESPVSYVTRDLDGKSYVEAREYALVNLGILYIKDGGENTLPFLEDLFERRFGEVSDYPVKTLEELIGGFPRNENDWARKLSGSSPPHSFYGKETLSALCSGDIHYMIRLVGRMVEENGGPGALRESTDIPRIKPKDQHDVVRAAAGDFLENVRMLPRHGERLAEIVTAFGNVARSYLKYRTSKNEKSNPPHQASRIEPYEALNLSEPASGLLKELLRYSIFLYDPRGKSRRGHVVPRLYMRRYLIPHFNLTFSQRDSVELENDELEQLLKDPRAFESAKRIKESRDDGITGDLFDEKDK